MLIELPEVLESIFSYEYTPGIYGLDIDTLDDFRENKVKVEKNRKYTSLLPFFCNCSDAINWPNEILDLPPICGLMVLKRKG